MYRAGVFYVHNVYRIEYPGTNLETDNIHTTRTTSGFPLLYQVPGIFANSIATITPISMTNVINCYLYSIMIQLRIVWVPIPDASVFVLLYENLNFRNRSAVSSELVRRPQIVTFGVQNNHVSYVTSTCCSNCKITNTFRSWWHIERHASDYYLNQHWIVKIQSIIHHPTTCMLGCFSAVRWNTFLSNFNETSQQ